MVVRKKHITESEAFSKMSALCAKSEYCIYDIRRKLAKWDMTQEERDNVIALLLKNKFIDEQRYAQAFIYEKFHYNGWGVMKIENELRLRGISQHNINEAKNEISESETLEYLKQILCAKRPSTHGKTQYEIKAKLYRYAYSKGYTTEQISKVIGDLD